MTKQLIRMLDDPSVPRHLRELLEVGAQDVATDYSYEQGLAQHLAHVAAATPPPAWAADLVATTKTTAAAGLSLKVIVAGVSIPVATAGVVAAVVFGGGRTGTPADGRPGSEAPAAVLPEAPEAEQMPDTGEFALSRRTERGEPTVIVQPADNASKGRWTGEPTASGKRTAQHRRRHARARPSPGHAPSEAPRSMPPAGVSSGPVTELDQIGGGQTTSAAEVVRGTSGHEVGTPTRRNDLHARWARGEDRSAAREKAAPAKARPRPPVQQELRPAPKAQLDPLQREMRMLAAANRLLESDPDRTLALARLGERDFPASTFSEERRYLIVMALIKLDRMDEARRLGLRFSRTYPHSPFAERIRRILASRAAED